MKNGQVVRVDTAGGAKLAIYVRTQKNGKPVVRQVYYNIGKEQAWDPLGVHPIPRSLMHTAASCAVAIEHMLGEDANLANQRDDRL